MQEKKLATQMFLANEDKVHKQTLKQFLRTYTFYLNKILLAYADPFIEKQNRQYLRQLDFRKLSKISNVFNRLTVEGKLSILNEIQKDPKVASIEVISNTSIPSGIRERSSSSSSRGSKSYISTSQHNALFTTEHSHKNNDVVIDP